MKEEMIKEMMLLIDKVITFQKEKLLQCGREFVPNLTSEDMLQPNDYPILENNPHFRYEEGILDGIQTTKAAILAFLKEP